MKVFLLCQQIREKSSPESIGLGCYRKYVYYVLHGAIVTIARTRCKQYVVVANLMHRLGVIYLVGASQLGALCSLAASPGLQVVKWNGNVLGHIIILQRRKGSTTRARQGLLSFASSGAAPLTLLSVSYIKYKACRRIYMGISLLLCYSPMWSERGNTLHNMFFMVAAVFHNDARVLLVVQKVWLYLSSDF